MEPTISVRTFKLHLARHQLLDRQIDDAFIQEVLGVSLEALVDGAMVMLREAISEKIHIKPVYIALRHKCPAGQEEHYEEYLQCNVRFNQPDNIIVYEDETCLKPSVDFHRADTVSFFGPIEKAKHQQQPTHFKDSVEFLIERSLIRGEPSREAVAKLLFLSVRTLQRRLSQENVTYQTLLDNTRKRLAQHYLKNPSVTHTEIALWLGYSEASQYYKAFKRWFGQTAKEFNVNRG